MHQLFTKYFHGLFQSGKNPPKSEVNHKSIFYAYLDLPDNVYEDIAESVKCNPLLPLRTLWCETEEVCGSGILGEKFLSKHLKGFTTWFTQKVISFTSGTVILFARKSQQE